MIELHGGATPNSRKVAIALLEFGERVALHHVDIEGGEQFSPRFLRLNPNGKQPVIVDSDVSTDEPLVIWESGAILQYLADKHGRLGGCGVAGRAAVAQWLMWQMSAVGPTGGQMAYFGRRCPSKVPIAIERFSLELQRLWAVLDAQLACQRFVAGNEYTIADIAVFPWWIALRDVPVVRRRVVRGQAWLPAILNLCRSRAPVYRHIEAWAEGLAGRAAVQAGMKVFEESMLPALDSLETGVPNCRPQRHLGDLSVTSPP